MKSKHLLVTVLSIIVLTGSMSRVFAQDSPAISGIFGSGAAYTINSEGNILGQKIALGVIYNKNMFILETILGGGTRKEMIGSFDYNYSYSIYRTGNIIWVDSQDRPIRINPKIYQTQDDGEIFVKYNVVDWMLSYNRVFYFSKKNKNHFRLGPGVGLLRYRDEFYLTKRNKNKEYTPHGLPENGRLDDYSSCNIDSRKYAFKAGITAGLRFSVVELHYCIFTSTPMNFPEKSLPFSTIAESEYDIVNYNVKTEYKKVPEKEFGRISHQITIGIFFM